MPAAGTTRGQLNEHHMPKKYFIFDDHIALPLLECQQMHECWLKRHKLSVRATGSRWV